MNPYWILCIRHLLNSHTCHCKTVRERWWHHTHTSASMQLLLNKVWNYISTINICMDVWTRIPKDTLYLTGLGLVLMIYWTRHALSNFDLFSDHSFYSIPVYDPNIVIGYNIWWNCSSVILSLVNVDIELHFHILKILTQLFFYTELTDKGPAGL